MQESSSPAPILTTPAVSKARHVLVPLTHEPGDQQAIQHAISVAKVLNAEIVLLHVITPFYLMNSGLIPMVWPVRYPDEQDYAQAKDYITKMAEQFIPRNQPWSLRLSEGNEADVITSLADELQPAHMVLPPVKPRSLATRLLFGELQRRLLHASHCKVEVAPSERTPDREPF